MINLRYLLGALLFISFLGCKNTPKEAAPEEKTKDLGIDQVEEVKDIYYRFPSPDEMLHFIDNKNLAFNDQYLLPVNNAKAYLDSRSQSLNLGIYIADLAYISLFQRHKEALEYFQIIYTLSDKLRISSAFDAKLIRRFENNLKNADSLKVLTDVALTSVTNYLVQNDKEKTFAIISIGGFIESLYLAFNLVGNYEADNPIIQRIFDQKLVLENLINYSLTYSDDVNVSESIKLLHPIRSCYNEMVVNEEKTTVAKKDGKLIISGGQKITISYEQFKKLKSIIFSVRKKITEEN